MNMLVYFVPVVAIVAMLFYTRWAQKNVRERAARGEGPQMFHDGYAGHFDALQPDERLIGVFMGLAYTKQDTTLAQAAGTLAKDAALSAVGVKTYVPMVYVGITTFGRVLVSEEYTEMGKRNHFKVVSQLPPGAVAHVGQQAYPQHEGTTPKNPYNADAPLELVRLVGENGDYLCWLTSAGAMTGASSFLSIGSVLPISAERAAGIWATASQPAAA